MNNDSLEKDTSRIMTNQNRVPLILIQENSFFGETEIIQNEVQTIANACLPLVDTKMMNSQNHKNEK